VKKALGYKNTKYKVQNSIIQMLSNTK